MHFYSNTTEFALDFFSSNSNNGLTKNMVTQNARKFGVNSLTKTKKKSLFSRLISALSEPMMLILLFGFIIALGTKLGTFIKSGESDFTECIGILLAIFLSVGITLIMEGSSKKAFDALNKLYDNLTVKVIRDGMVVVVSQRFVVAGDIILLESGDKIIADGRLIESENLMVDESALTGESIPTKKDASARCVQGCHVAERINSVFSGTFITSGKGKMIVTAVGDSTEMGKIAKELSEKTTEGSPLSQKLARLGKIISIIGIVVAILVFALSVVKLITTNNFTFDSVQELFVSSIILIVAAVPEGLPTIVAVSLALNMIKLARENALIKKMHAAETTGAVSIICSDKTGTLTQNKMTVVKFCSNTYNGNPQGIKDLKILQNFVCNSTVEIVRENSQEKIMGSATEGALIKCCENSLGESYSTFRKSFEVINSLPFSSENKFMITQIKSGEKYSVLIKGAPEVVLRKCKLTINEVQSKLREIEKYQQNAERVICFAHIDSQVEIENLNDIIDFVFDGYAVITDPVRPEVFEAVKDCYNAGIKIKMLTGDNQITAFAIAKKLGIVDNMGEVVNAADLELLDDVALARVLERVSVIARSTPMLKLKIVRVLKAKGEIVAVTGDGINDAPAIKHADVGIAMGISGSQITKEAADVVLLDDSFSTVVKAISFGRNVYRNLQRFILFQLSVNLTALLVITVCAILGLKSPFNTLQLLWINVIMDGPPALTLGLERAGKNIMKAKPVSRNENIVSLKMFLRILFNGVFMGGIILLQYLFNILKVNHYEMGSVVFTLFVLFQLFNAFNCRELGGKSIFLRAGKNKIMAVTFLAVFIVHVFIVEVCSTLFGIYPMSIITWVKCIITSSLIVIVSEFFKWGYRVIYNNEQGNLQKFLGKRIKKPN